MILIVQLKIKKQEYRRKEILMAIIILDYTTMDVIVKIWHTK
jgi:hypothetical protein